MVMDADTGEPLGMAPGRDRNGLESFFSRFNEEEKEKIKFLGYRPFKRVQGGSRSAPATCHRVL